MQTIPTGIWVELLGYDVEVLQQTGAVINVTVVDQALVTEPAGAKCVLRPTASTPLNGWSAPIAGWYLFGSRRTLLPSAGTVAEIVFDQAARVEPPASV